VTGVRLKTGDATDSTGIGLRQGYPMFNGLHPRYFSLGVLAGAAVTALVVREASR
jgi:hypothetical protein